MPKASSVRTDGSPDGFVNPRSLRAQISPDGTTRLVVYVPPDELRERHLLLLRALGTPLSLRYVQLTDRATGALPRPLTFVRMDIPADEVLAALDAAADLVWHDGRHQIWVRGRFGEQVVLDELGVLYCYPDDPSFRDALADLVRPFAARVGTLDFWTEAAMWSAFGADAIVIGPGDIAQAHAADEWVSLELPLRHAVFESLKRLDESSEVERLLPDDAFRSFAPALHAVSAAVVADVEAHVKSVLEPLLADFKAEQGYRDTLARGLDNQAFEIARQRMASDFPILKDKAKFRQARTRAYQLANLQGYRDEAGEIDVDKSLSDAVDLLFKNELKDTQRQQLSARQRSQLDGQPSSVQSPSAGPPAAMSVDDELVDVQRRLVRGESVAEIKRRPRHAAASA
jgi:hypothetical protein